MTKDKKDYHRTREQQCREMAEHASDPDIRRRHEELAALHHSQVDSQPADTPANV